MPEMREHQSAINTDQGRSWVSLAFLVWNFLCVLGNVQMDDWIDDPLSCGLVDGNYLRCWKKGLCVEIQKMVFGTQETVLLPRMQQ